MTTDQGRGLTGADLRARRKAAGLTQETLARLAGCRRGAVAYWESKAQLDLRGALPRRLCEWVGLYDNESSTRERARASWGLTQDQVAARIARGRAERSARADARVDRIMATEMVRQARREAEQTARCERRRTHGDTALEANARARCGARTGKGTPCQCKVEPGRTRCRFHGGRSTGPKTPEGRARIAEAQRQRWAAWRAQREASEIDTKERTS